MKTRRKPLFAGVMLAAGAALLAAFPLDTLTDFGGWLRALSLSGSRGNLAAWSIVLVLTALPALGLLWRGRCLWDLLLFLAAGEIFAGLYFLVNPTFLNPLFGSSLTPIWGLAASGTAAATLLAWAVLRGLGRLERTEALGAALEKLLRWSAALLGWLAAWNVCGELLEKIRAAAEANTAPGLELLPTNLTLCLLAALELLPTLLGCAVLLWGGKLALALDADPFGGETVALAERLSRHCGQVAAVSVLLCAGGNLLQMLLFPLLRTSYFRVTFPAATVLLAAALGLLCRYFRRAKAVNDDNESII